MATSSILNKARNLWSNMFNIIKCQDAVFVRLYANTSEGCRRAIVDIPPDGDPVCPEPCDRTKKKKGILHRIKLKVVEGGTNFGTPFRRLRCAYEKAKENKNKEEGPESQTKALPAPTTKVATCPEPRPGVQVSILGADTAIGQYVALLLKQCPCIKKLRLYDARNCPGCNRDMANVVEDLHHINTNCRVQAFSCSCLELDRCLQNTDIVLMLESGCLTSGMPFEKRFSYQAPIVKRYADAIANECPKAFIIVCATPIDCMVPLIAETLRETNWYDPRKLLGSLAVQEMRASTLAARALCLEPLYTRVPCVGGTEGRSLVPLFSMAVDYYDFTKCNAEMMTDVVRSASISVGRCDGVCPNKANLSEAHALSRLVTNVAHAQLCNDVPRISGFVETDASQIISPARYIANQIELDAHGVLKNFGLPKLTDLETSMVDTALIDLSYKMKVVEDWYLKYRSSSSRFDTTKKQFFMPRSYEETFDDCAYAHV